MEILFLVWVLFIRGAMTKEEISKFVESLPNVDKDSYFYSPVHFEGKDRYIYVLAKEGTNTNEYLLDTGEVVKGAARVVFKDQVETHIGLGYTYLGIGLLHKKI